MLPLLLYEMHRAAARPIPLPSSVGIAELANGVETDRDYDIGMRNIESQKAHDVHATSSLRFEEDVWDCSTSDGYMCHCKRQAAAGGLADGGQLQLASGTAGTGQGARGRGRRRGRGQQARPAHGGGAMAERGQVAGRAMADVPADFLAGGAAGGGTVGGAAAGASASGGGGGRSSGVGAGGGSCPAGGNLEDPAQLDAMLAARATAERDVVITILGPTTGSRAIQMDEDIGESFVCVRPTLELDLQACIASPTAPYDGARPPLSVYARCRRWRWQLGLAWLGLARPDET